MTRSIMDHYPNTLRAIACALLTMAFALSLPRVARATDSAQVQACKANTCVAFCKELGLDPGRQTAQCVSQCRASCAPGDPPPITVKPKYLIVSLVYAPPGCTTAPSGQPSQCGTTNGAAFVDYNNSSANGSKVSTKDSFTLGVTISYDGTSLIGLGGGGSYGFSQTNATTDSVNVTKSQSFDLKVAGNGDGVDHGQDFFVLLIHPSITLKKHGDAIQWNFTDGGNLFEVYVSELRRPSTMRPSTAQVLNEAGFTTADYQAILKEDPFGGAVCTLQPALCSIVNTNIGSATTMERATGTTAYAAPALDPHRFWLTGMSFPYQPALNSPNCNGGICNCPVVSNAFINDKLTDLATEDTGTTTVDLYGDAGVPKVWSLKLDTKLSWTTTATTDNTTESKQTATATLTCPSTAYKGPYGMQVYWDTRYGSFVFVPYDPGAVSMLHQGTVLDGSGHAVAGQLVSMTFNGKTQRTLTASDGTYRFPSPTGSRVISGTAVINAGGIKQTVNVGTIKTPVILHIKQVMKPLQNAQPIR